MSKKFAVFVLATSMLASVHLAEAQQTGNKVSRIGILRSGSSSFYVSQHEVVRQGLRELGYIEGKNLLIEYRYAESKLGRLPDLAAELVRLKVDVLVISPSPATIRAAQGATRTIPIVMMGFVFDPVKAGIVVSLRRPGGNITGPINPRPELDPKRLELLKEAFPQISRVVVVWSPGQHKDARKEVEAVGQALGIQIQYVVTALAVRPLDDVEGYLSAISQQRPEALFFGASFFLIRHRARIIEFAAKRRLPTIYSSSRNVRAGGLMSYGTDRYNLVRRTATYVAKILKGAKPADLPVEQPTKFDFVINLKTAKQLGFTFSPQFLARADKVIK